MESPIVNRLPHQSSLKRTVCNGKQYKKSHIKNMGDFEDNPYGKCYHGFYSDFDDGHFGYQVIYLLIFQFSNVLVKLLVPILTNGYVLYFLLV